MKLNVGNFQIKEDIVLFGSQNTKIKIESIVQKKALSRKNCDVLAKQKKIREIV